MENNDAYTHGVSHFLVVLQSTSSHLPTCDMRTYEQDVILCEITQGCAKLTDYSIIFARWCQQHKYGQSHAGTHTSIYSYK